MKYTLALVVLAGGKSSRMGQDKASLPLSCLPYSFLQNHEYISNYKNSIEKLEKLDFLWQSLRTLSLLQQKYSFIEPEIFLSCRQEQEEFFSRKVLQYPDIAKVKFVFDNGTGVCDAFISILTCSQKAVLCLPCDAPFVTASVLEMLIEAWQQNPSHLQYTFVDPINDRRETLISLYNPRVKECFETSITQKIRIQNSIPKNNIYQIPFFGDLRSILRNINTKEELKTIN